MKIGDTVPGFDLPDQRGASVTLDELLAEGHLVLYFYIKAAHLGEIPGLKEYAEFFLMDEVAGPDGPLAEYGLVSDPELAETQAAVAEERFMN